LRKIAFPMFGASIRGAVFGGIASLSSRPGCSEHRELPKPKQPRAGSVVKGAAGNNAASATMASSIATSRWAPSLVHEADSRTIIYGLRRKLPVPGLGLIRIDDCFQQVQLPSSSFAARPSDAAHDAESVSGEGRARLGRDFFSNPRAAVRWWRREFHHGRPRFVFFRRQRGLAWRRQSGDSSVARRRASPAGGNQVKEAQQQLSPTRAVAYRWPQPRDSTKKKLTCHLGLQALWRRRRAAGGGYGNTNEGKIIAAAVMDNYTQSRRRSVPQRSSHPKQRRHDSNRKPQRGGTKKSVRGLQRRRRPEAEDRHRHSLLAAPSETGNGPSRDPWQGRRGSSVIGEVGGKGRIDQRPGRRQAAGSRSSWCPSVSVRRRHLRLAARDGAAATE